jgi:hypothetical protein
MAASPKEKENLEMLQTLLAEHDRVFRLAVETVNRERPIVFSLKNAIAALKGERISTLPWGTAIFRHSPGESVSVGTSGLAIQPLPGRKSEFANMTIMASLQKVLAKKPGEFVHADELVKEIYEPTEDNDIFYRIKRTLVSELLRGMKKALFVRGPGKNTFGLGLVRNGTQKEGRPTL